MKFNVEETNLICMNNFETKSLLIQSLSNQLKNLKASDIELKQLAVSTINKVKDIKEDDFEKIKLELISDYE